MTTSTHTKTPTRPAPDLREASPDTALARVTTPAEPPTEAPAPAAESQPRPPPAPLFAQPAHPAGIARPGKRSFLSRYGTALLIAGSVATGAVLQIVVSEASKRIPAPAAKPVPITVRGPVGAIGPVTLNGPGGPVTLPMSTPAVVNIWLEGCPDCMPAFEAMQKLQDANALDTTYPTVNVAYGSATMEWAQRYRLTDKLVFDPSGAALVQPLGVSTFTTIIIDEQGRVRLRERPDASGFADRVAGAVRALKTRDSPPSAGR